MPRVDWAVQVVAPADVAAPMEMGVVVRAAAVAEMDAVYTARNRQRHL